MNENAPLLSVKDLSIKNGDKLILKKINFDVKPGEVVGIIGESGSGKSTICKAIIGLLSPDFSIKEGEITYRNYLLSRLTNERMRRLRGSDISIIMQNSLSLFNPSRTIGTHFYESLKEHTTLSKKEMKRIATHYLNKLNLPHAEEIMKKYPYQLSGGMLQRTMIAISLCLEPKILIADEPTTSLDNINQKKFSMNYCFSTRNRNSPSSLFHMI